jgi:hypothetical protein
MELEPVKDLGDFLKAVAKVRKVWEPKDWE